MECLGYEDGGAALPFPLCWVTTLGSFHLHCAPPKHLPVERTHSLHGIIRFCKLDNSADVELVGQPCKMVPQWESAISIKEESYP